MGNARYDKIIGLLTTNSRLYFDLVKVLKARKLEFRSLNFDEPVNLDIGVVMTGQEDFDKVDFSPKVNVTDVYRGVREAIQMLCGDGPFKELVIGADPGKYPGIAVVVEGEVIEALQANSTEQAIKIVKDMLEAYCFERSRLRIGHGAPDSRNQILNKVSQLFSIVEIVDESSTTKRTKTPDIDAAITIARSKGHIEQILNT